MIEYLFLLVAIVCIGLQFALTKVFQKKVENNFFTSFTFFFASAIVSSILLLVVCKFKISINIFSLLMATGGTLCIALYNILSIKMMSIGKVAVYTMFVMMGGMFIPFLYGVIFLSEELTLWKILGVIVLIIALIMQIGKSGESENKNYKLFAILSIIVFIANGMVGVFNKMHQISNNAISTYEFCFLQNLISSIVLGIIITVYYLINNEQPKLKKDFKAVNSQWGIIVFYAVCALLGCIFQLYAAVKIDASVMFPVVTGGVMVISTVFGTVLFKEVVNKRLIVSLLFAITATILFVV